MVLNLGTCGFGDWADLKPGHAGRAGTIGCAGPSNRDVPCPPGPEHEQASGCLHSGPVLRYGTAMDVREALLRAAVKVFAEVGTRGATTRRIASEAGVNEVTLFRHFRSKEELLQAALEHQARQVVSTHVLPAEPVDPRRELVDWCRAHHRALYKVRALIRKSMSEFEEFPEHCSQGMQASIRIANDLSAYLRRLKQTGLATGDWNDRAATAMLMGAIFTDAMGRDTMPERYPYSMRESVEHYVDLLLAAIGVRPAALAGPSSVRGKALS
jgi:AcrR family transcriptional regulator